MKKIFSILVLVLVLIGESLAMSVTAPQSTGDKMKQGAKSVAKGAKEMGESTAEGTKKVAKKVAKTTKKAGRKTKKGVKKGVKKVGEGTEKAGQKMKEAGK